jgi:D-ribose pyranase
MKKLTLLNWEISYLIAKLGHTDMIVIADSGLPIPKSIQRIDLALSQGIPSFIETLKAVLSEKYIEKVWIAEELRKTGHPIYSELTEILGQTEIEAVTHERFKEVVA